MSDSLRQRSLWSQLNQPCLRVINTSVVLLCIVTLWYCCRSSRKTVDGKQRTNEMQLNIQKMLSDMDNKMADLLTRLKKEIKEEMAVILEERDQKIKMVMQSQLEIYDADKTGLTDYALGMAGGKIITTRATETYNSGFPVPSVFGVPLCTQINQADAILQPSVMPGQCWAVIGQRASVVIQLIAQICVTDVSLEHIPKSLSPSGEIDSAPKEFSVWGLTDKGDKDPHFFGQFVYNKEGPPLQTFAVQKSETRVFSMIEFKLHSNYGHNEYTCIYRIRVHGNIHRPYRYNH